MEQGHRRRRQPVGVGVRGELSTGAHPLEAVPQTALPAVEARGQGGARDRVALGELPHE